MACKNIGNEALENETYKHEASIRMYLKRLAQKCFSQNSQIKKRQTVNGIRAWKTS